MHEELIYQKTEHDQVKDHLTKKSFYECKNKDFCGDKLKETNLAVTKNQIFCPRCGHVLVWSRLTEAEVDFAMEEFAIRKINRIKEEKVKEQKRMKRLGIK